MSRTTGVLRLGLDRGLIELRHTFSGTDLINQLVWPAIALVALFLLRNRSLGGGEVDLGAFALPSMLGMFVAFGMLLMVQYLAADREDGTLLRAKATPHGIRGYFLGKLVLVSGSVLVYLVILSTGGGLLIGGLRFEGVGSWLTLLCVLGLGLVSTQSIGAVLGSLIGSPRGAGYISFVALGLIAISGIFYPITALPGWLQGVAQAFPVYWLGLGMRAALLPGGAAAVEIGDSWRLIQTAGVLGAWAALGVLLAPVVLRRMARRESGSAVAERRERALRRVG